VEREEAVGFTTVNISTVIVFGPRYCCDQQYQLAQRSQYHPNSTRNGKLVSITSRLGM
jgi:hypothetical protein